MVPRLVSLLRTALLAAALALAAGTGAAPAAAQTVDPTTPAPTTPNPTPPSVFTGGAEAVSQNAATFSGSVAAGGAPTTVRFEYGTTTGYGLTTGPIEVPAQTTELQVRAPVVGLTGGTTYHFRLVATNAAGTTQGLDRAFTTVGVARAPYVQTRSATALTSSGATLVARVNPRAQPTTVYWEYGPSASYGLRTAEQTIPAGNDAVFVQLPLGGLDANTTYSYRAVAVNPAGTARGNRHTFRTTRGISGVTIKLATRNVTWSQKAFVGGQVSGLSVNAVKVTLWKQDHPFTGPFRAVATTTASQAGTYGFTTDPLYWSTRFRVTADTAAGAASPTTTTLGRLYTKLRVSGRKRTSMRLRGLVYPATKGKAEIQRRTPKGRWVKVKTVNLSPVSTGSRSGFSTWVPRLASRSARYRAVVTPNDAGAHVVTSTASTLVKRR